MRMCTLTDTRSDRSSTIHVRLLDQASGSSATYDGGTRYHPSGISMRFPLSVHAPSIRIHTRIEELGPTRMGLASGTNTVLFGLQPSPNASTSAPQRIAIHIRVDSGSFTRHAFVEPVDEADGDGGHDALKHLALSRPSRKSIRCLRAPPQSRHPTAGR